MFKQSKECNNPLHIVCILLIIVDITTKMNLLMANIPYHLATTYGGDDETKKISLIKPVHSILFRNVNNKKQQVISISETKDIEKRSYTDERNIYCCQRKGQRKRSQLDQKNAAYRQGYIHNNQANRVTLNFILGYVCMDDKVSKSLGYLFLNAPVVTSSVDDVIAPAPN